MTTKLIWGDAPYPQGPKKSRNGAILAIPVTNLKAMLLQRPLRNQGAPLLGEAPLLENLRYIGSADRNISLFALCLPILPRSYLLCGKLTGRGLDSTPWMLVERASI